MSAAVSDRPNRTKTERSVRFGSAWFGSAGVKFGSVRFGSAGKIFGSVRFGPVRLEKSSVRWGSVYRTFMIKIERNPFGSHYC